MAEKKEKKEEKFDIKNFKDCFKSVQELIERPKRIISVCPSLDATLGGGIPESSFVVITGPPKVGKSTLSLQFASNCQSEDGGYKKIYYFNIEGRIKQRDLEGIYGLQRDVDKFTLIGSTPGTILYAHDHLDIALHLLKTEQNCLIILDSVSQLCSEGRISESVGSRFRDDVPLMLASFTKQAANILPIHNNIVIVITHIIANQGNGPAQNMEASGRKIQYQGDVKIKGTYSTPYLVGETQLGQEVHWLCEYSAIGPPMQKCTSLIRYGVGIDKEYDLVKMCEEIGLIKKGGAWYTIGEQKVQGMEKTCEYLRQNPKIYKELQTQLKELTS